MFKLFRSNKEFDDSDGNLSGRSNESKESRTKKVIDIHAEDESVDQRYTLRMLLQKN